jgi:hypothetical protein
MSNKKSVFSSKYHIKLNHNNDSQTNEHKNTKINTMIIDSLSDSDNDNDNNNDNDSYYENKNDQNNKVLNLADILNVIPADHSKEPNNELQKTHIEHRWRFFNINGRKIIEISKKKPNEQRLYVDNTNGEWITHNELDIEWNNFLVDVKYCYVK